MPPTPTPEDALQFNPDITSQAALGNSSQATSAQAVTDALDTRDAIDVLYLNGVYKLTAEAAEESQTLQLKENIKLYVDAYLRYNYSGKKSQYAEVGTAEDVARELVKYSSIGRVYLMTHSGPGVLEFERWDASDQSTARQERTLAQFAADLKTHSNLPTIKEYFRFDGCETLKPADWSSESYLAYKQGLFELRTVLNVKQLVGYSFYHVVYTLICTYTGSGFNQADIEAKFNTTLSTQYHDYMIEGAETSDMAQEIAQGLKKATEYKAVLEGFQEGLATGKLDEYIANGTLIPRTRAITVTLTTEEEVDAMYEQYFHGVFVRGDAEQFLKIIIAG